jgi:hypothetical protein
LGIVGYERTTRVTTPGRRQKRGVDEEGAIGRVINFRYRWKYTPSGKWYILIGSGE